MKKLLILTLIVTMLVTTLAGCGSATMDEINKNTNIAVASIGDEDIFAYEMIYLMKMGATKEEALNEWQTIKTFLAKAKEFNITLSEDDIKNIDTQWDEAVTQYGGEEAFLAELTNFGITADQYKEISRTLLIVEKIGTYVSENKIMEEVTDDEVLDFYNANFLRAQHILFATLDENNQQISEEEMKKKKANAEDIVAKIKAGAAFEDFVNLSEDPGLESSPNGYTFLNSRADSVKDDEMILGYMQQIGIPIMVEEFEQGAANLEVNEVSDVIESDFGYHIIKKLDLHGDNNEYEEMKSAISYVLNSVEYNGLIEQWKAELKQKTNKYYEALQVEPAAPQQSVQPQDGAADGE